MKSSNTDNGSLMVSPTQQTATNSPTTKHGKRTGCETRKEAVEDRETSELLKTGEARWRTCGQEQL